MAIVVADTATDGTQTGSGTSFSTTYPTSASVGDVLLIAIATNNAAFGGSVSTPTLTGSPTVTAVTNSPKTSSGNGARIYCFVAVVNSAGSNTWTVGHSNDGSSVVYAILMARITGVNTSSVLGTATAFQLNDGSSTTTTSPSVTPPTGNLLVTVAAFRDGTTTITYGGTSAAIGTPNQVQGGSSNQRVGGGQLTGAGSAVTPSMTQTTDQAALLTFDLNAASGSSSPTGPSTASINTVPMRPGPGGFTAGQVFSLMQRGVPVPYAVQATNAPPPIRMMIPMRQGPGGFAKGTPTNSRATSTPTPIIPPIVTGSNSMIDRRRRR